MFGSLRLLLAFMVLLSHLVGSDYFTHYGAYAVRGFFVLSGFLMTAGLQEIYKFDANRFWTNRFLRLLPPYYIVCAVTLVAIMLAPEAASLYQGQWQLDRLWEDAITNVVVLPLTHSEPQFRLVPPYWSIAIEIEMYLLLFFCTARSEKRALASLAVGVLYHAVCYWYDVGFGYRYYGALSALLSFPLGALIYFWRKRGLLSLNNPAITAAMLALWVANTAAAGWILPLEYAEGVGYYLNSCLFMAVVAGLVDVRFAPVLQTVDKAFGEIAYPVFLVQWVAGFLTALWLMPGTWRGWTLMLATIPLMLLMAVGLALINHWLIDPVRARIRRGERAGEGAGDPARYRGPEPELARGLVRGPP